MKLILLGAPGVGKGTISDLMVSKLNLKHISTGNLFREAIKKGDEFGLNLKKVLEEGHLVDDDSTNKVAKDAIDECVKNNIGFILDGYPRSIEQAKYLDSIINIDYVFFLDADNEVLLNRISGRRICPNCNAIYNINTNVNPTKDNVCDNCNSILIQRKDDSIETAKKRIETYFNQTFPVIDYYKQKNKLYKINALKDIDSIFNDILKICK